MSTENRWLLTRDFRLIWWSQVLSQVADGVSRLALLWFVYSVTGSALQTSVVGLLQTLSPILLGPFIGVTVDRLPKKAILIVTDGALEIGAVVAPRGSTLLLPAADGPVTVRGEGELLIARPPAA